MSMYGKKNVLHIITISFVINHFFGRQFQYLKSKTGNRYYLGCSPSSELDELAPQLDYEPFPVPVLRSISPLADLNAIWKIYRFLKRNNIDTIVGHTPKGGMVSMLAGALAGTKSRIYFRHGIIYETSSGFKKFLLKNIDRLSGSLAHKVVCVSNSVKQRSIDDNLNTPSKNIILGLGTCNGIDTDIKFNPDHYTDDEVKRLREQHNIKENDFVIGYVGRLVKDKGINELIQAWKILKQNNSNIKLLLVGPFEEKDAVSEETHHIIETDPDIIHTGFILVAAPYYRLMDTFILPTYREGFPTVTLEASSMKVPVLTTRATGCTESIIENETGLFINHSPEDIADKISFLIDNPAIRKQFGENGRVFVHSNFEQTKIWDLIHEKLGY